MGRHYDPAQYWEGRATELAAVYDQPETWATRGWPSDELERRAVPEMLGRAEARSVLVIGCGSGRQYGFLAPLGFELSGFDISPTLVRICNERYREIPSQVDNVVGAHRGRAKVDAVYSSHVLQHIEPESIEQAVDSVKRMARKLIVIREARFLKCASDYQWAHDYTALFNDWALSTRITTDNESQYCTELIAFSVE